MKREILVVIFSLPAKIRRREDPVDADNAPETRVRSGGTREIEHAQASEAVPNSAEPLGIDYGQALCRG